MQSNHLNMLLCVTAVIIIAGALRQPYRLRFEMAGRRIMDKALTNGCVQYFPEWKMYRLDTLYGSYFLSNGQSVMVTQVWSKGEWHGSR